MDLATKQVQELAVFFTSPEPGDPPRDPKTLGDPSRWGPYQAYVDLMQLGRDPITQVFPMIPPELQLPLVQADPSGGPQVNPLLAQRWKVLGIADLLKPPKRPEYLVDSMLRTPGLSCGYGVPGDLKSMLFMDLAVCVASGQPWLEPLPKVGTGGAYQVKQGAVLWFDQDNGQNRLQERFGALCRARGVDIAPLHAISFPRPVFDVSKPEEAELLAEQIDALGAIFCVCDNLGTISGGRDENSSQMVDVMGGLRWITEKTGAHLATIHHARKGIGTPKAREGDRLRGHSSIEASLDLAILIERAGDDLTVKSTKTRDDPISPFVARWTFEKNQDGALEKARFWHVEELKAKRPEYITAGEELPDLLRGMIDAPNQNQLAKTIEDTYEIKRAQALEAIKYAVSRGLITEEKTGEGKTSPKLYKVGM